MTDKVDTLTIVLDKAYRVDKSGWPDGRGVMSLIASSGSTDLFRAWSFARDLAGTWAVMYA